ncbi:small ribosomal subunit protein bS21c-like [Magnolia sinica]|uniref:small ribosomal subunit protein bS21c-like n=1 Tax=Magnolia sinica TaxID=86752 RepID=UPI00265A0267|nr:small ribosomal subunit protein bS21c-like [Magnolia sinica]
MASLCSFLSFRPSKPPILSSSSSSHLSFLLPSPPPCSLSLTYGRGRFPIIGIGSSSFPSSHSLSYVFPSLGSSTRLLCRSGYNVQVVVEDNEPEESLVRRFRSKVLRAGVIQECKRRRFFENKQDKKKRKAREASKRNRWRFRFFIHFSFFQMV